MSSHQLISYFSRNRQVYEGTYQDRNVAIKALDAKDPVATCDALKKEGSFFWQLNHKNIVHLYGEYGRPTGFERVNENYFNVSALPDHDKRGHDSASFWTHFLSGSVWDIYSIRC